MEFNILIFSNIVQYTVGFTLLGYQPLSPTVHFSRNKTKQQRCFFFFFVTVRTIMWSFTKRNIPPPPTNCRLNNIVFMMTQMFFAGDFKAMKEPKIASVFCVCFFFSLWYCYWNSVYYMVLHSVKISFQKKKRKKKDVSTLYITVMHVEKIIFWWWHLVKMLGLNHLWGIEIENIIHKEAFRKQLGSAGIMVPSKIKYLNSIINS